MLKVSWLDLTPVQVGRYGALLFGVLVVIAGFYVATSSVFSPHGHRMLSDLSVFWIAAVMGLDGQGGMAYQEPALRAALLHFIPQVQGNFGWFYPPAYYLLILPLGYFSHYFPVYFAWMIPNLGLFAWMIRKIMTRSSTAWFVAAGGGVWLNLLYGQNGFLTASLALGILLLLKRHEQWAGVLLGILTIKPQLLVVFPLVFILSRAWKGLGVALIVCLMLNGLGVIVVGQSVLEGWWHSMSLARTFLEQDGRHSHYWVHMPTLFAQCRLWGMSLPVAYGLHWFVAGLAWATLIMIWKATHKIALRGSAVVVAALLSSPYLMNYDLVWLSLILVWMVELGQREGWFRGERVILILLWILPIFGYFLAEFMALQIGPEVLLVEMGLIWRHARYSVPMGSEAVLLEPTSISELG
ncbi:MAG: DUF2029 domain-containing protein [Ferrovum sp.]|nr:DUF2029 domain-containing protein [Ferrovum sp.]NDU87089.1 DUF2029 domain-containing protein [Ferrovum sp.]